MIKSKEALKIYQEQKMKKLNCVTKTEKEREILSDRKGRVQENFSESYKT